MILGNEATLEHLAEPLLLEAEEKKVVPPPQLVKPIPPKNAPLRIQFEAAMANCAGLKNEGTKKYEAGDYKGALRSYQAALATIPPGLMEELCFSQNRGMMTALGDMQKRCKINCTLAKIGMKMYYEAIQEATEIIEGMDDSDAKAYQYRAWAEKARGKTDQALIDLKTVRAGTMR